MSRDARFWRNVALIGLAHVAVVIALVRWNRESPKPIATNIVWIGGFAGAPAETPSEVAAEPEPNSAAPSPPEIEPEPSPSTAPVKSEIELPTPTPQPTATATPRPAVTPKPKTTPKATPKPTPKPKSTAPKATPKPTPKKDRDPEAKKKEKTKAPAAKSVKADSDPKPTKTTAGVGSGTEKAGSGGNGGTGSSAAGASETGWYGNMLHDRFHGEWVQPTSVVATGAKISALARIRIEKDGRVSKFEIVKPSGNVAVDESVEAVSKKVTQVDPLPKGVGGDHYDVNINFELNPEQ